MKQVPRRAMNNIALCQQAELFMVTYVQNRLVPPSSFIF
jgi:hypothetical protein